LTNYLAALLDQPCPHPRSKLKTESSVAQICKIFNERLGEKFARKVGKFDIEHPIEEKLLRAKSPFSLTGVALSDIFAKIHQHASRWGKQPLKKLIVNSPLMMAHLDGRDVEILQKHYWTNLPMGNIIFVPPEPNYQDIKEWCDKTNEGNQGVWRSGYTPYDAERIYRFFDKVNQTIEDLPHWIKPPAGRSSIHCLSQSDFPLGVFYQYQSGGGWSYQFGSLAQSLGAVSREELVDIAVINNQANNLKRIFSL
jgi:hypothetical protein